MTEEQKKNYERYWREREYQKELHKRHPDLANLHEMRNGISQMQENLQEELDEHPNENHFNGRWRDDIESDIEFLGKVHHHLDKELKELFAKYGEEEHGED